MMRERTSSTTRAYAGAEIARGQHRPDAGTAWCLEPGEGDRLAKEAGQPLACFLNGGGFSGGKPVA